MAGPGTRDRGQEGEGQEMTGPIRDTGLTEGK